MKFKMFNKKVGTILVLLTVSLIFLTKISQAEEKLSFMERFSLKLTGGLAYVSVGDINRSIDSFNNGLKEAVRYSNDSLNGEIEELNYGFDWEAELRIDISDKVGIGFATGYIHLKNESSLTYTIRGWDRNEINIYSFEPKVTAVPLKLRVYYTLPVTPKSKLFLNGGIGYYFAKCSQGEKRKWRSVITDRWWNENKYWEVNSGNFGFHGGIGIEYNLTKNLALMIEGEGRYAKIKKLKGKGKWIWEPKEVNGTLYYYTWFDWRIGEWGEWYDGLAVFESVEAGNRRLVWERVLREAILDLSGFSLRVGIKIKLF
ncbi:MAG: outer membrane beta-barrel protein [Candidatus Aminicenantia bacterium]